MKLNREILKNSFFAIFVALLSVSSLLEISNNRNKITRKLSSYSNNTSKNNSIKESNTNIYDNEQMNIASDWSKKILKGNYILFFRHADLSDRGDGWFDLGCRLRSDLAFCFRVGFRQF